MVRSSLIALFTVASMMPGMSWAQAPIDPELASGIRLVHEGELEQAVLTLDGVARRLTATGGRASELSRAYAYLAIAYMGLSQREKAKQKFIDAWKADREMSLSPREFPPAVISMFEEARREAEAGTAQPTPRPTPGRGGGSTLLFVGGGGLAIGAGVALASGGSGGGVKPRPTPRVELLEDSSMRGNDRHVVVGFDVVSCQAACLSYDWCQAFMVIKGSPDQCFLKDVRSIVFPDPCCTVGIVTRP